jgi:putative pyruvate formate lyase activating enzyme
VDRTAGETGYCGGGLLPRVASYGPHFGEEPPLVGTAGSGTIFFSGCNLRCVFCQNWDISHENRGREVTTEELAGMMLALQRSGCHNVNLVTPTHFTPQIIEALNLAREGGLRVPVIYNCGGYEKVETLSLLKDLVDIYMPDIKFATERPGAEYCNAPDYAGCAREALREMHLQVGELEVTGGLARRGLLVRHLVMPGGVEEAGEVFRFIAEEISPETCINVMGQYRPLHRADRHPAIARRPRSEEMTEAVDRARRVGLGRICF